MKSCVNWSCCNGNYVLSMMIISSIVYEVQRQVVKISIPIHYRILPVCTTYGRFYPLVLQFRRVRVSERHHTSIRRIRLQFSTHKIIMRVVTSACNERALFHCNNTPHSSFFPSLFTSSPDVQNKVPTSTPVNTYTYTYQEEQRVSPLMSNLVTESSATPCQKYHRWYS